MTRPLTKNNHYQVSIYPSRMLLSYVGTVNWTIGEEVTAVFHLFEEENRRVNRPQIPESRLEDWVLGLDRIESFRVFIPTGRSLCQAMFNMGAEIHGKSKRWVYHLEDTIWQCDNQPAVPAEGGTIATLIRAQPLFS